jgi:hypothetical protein
MNESILDSTKKILGLSSEYTAFDHDIISHLNSALVSVGQLGVGPEAGFMITDNTATWADFLGDDIMYNTVKSYVYLKVRILFDPPATSFHVKAIEDQMSELEWRISAHRESKLPSAVPLRF